ncbi:hypothetical protein HBH64_236860 [Parastagonospora nodorum]|nr:hypothetical protein HBH99_218070 [Parastagonospora nodorum]KAH4736645.1 hypothetical protein HBH64_236860 [Parastagonospora nodorum]KAH5753368.1 hypothetical protein HBI16_238840 [Parastagonospora nodorum]KAH5977515.1 hypothetical protein HBI85_001000 [Parastagonospora nodorum]KAH5993374.1 hypothetical protein HBI82_182780 [Parastagonospora nodorum]
MLVDSESFLVSFPGHPCKYNNEHPRRQGSATSISVGGSYNASLAWSLRSLLSDIVIWKGTAVAIATFQEDRSSTLKSTIYSSAVFQST